MMLAKFEDLLKRTMGLDVAAVGSSAVARAVQVRASACGLESARTYWELVSASPNELQALTEAVVVAETWFFRDREAFAALARMALQDWLPTNPKGVLRLLSLPCSSGEEPYSMAMALLDAGFPSKRYSIDAIDISARILTHAERATYGKNSFRGAELGFRARHFEVTPHGHRLKDAVRQTVRFQRGNLLDATFLPGVEMYDIIFCRNLLIYFDRATQERAIQVLRRILTADGVLFAGPSEAGLLLSHGFVAIKVPLAFALRKVGPVRRPAESVCAHPIKEPLTRRQITSPPAGLDALLPNPPGPGAPAEPAALAGAGTGQASMLADQGRLSEAAKSCKEHLRAHGPSAQTLHLLGLISSAAGNLPEAAEYFRKTLYLDPNHTPSLVHLALLLEKQGDKAGAKVLNARVRRLDRREAKRHG
jgi:chemotaxis protein methyltransferase WspC